MQELERQFKADGGTFKEYKIGDLFVPMKGRNKLTKLDLSPKGNIPVFSSDSSNNGICGFTDKNPDFIVNETNPVFVVFGDHTRTLNIAETSFCVMDNVKVLRPRYNNILALLYFFSVWKKGIPNLGYARHWSVAVNVKLYLPVINGDIDFDYMESYIHELQNESLIKLNDYLKLNGLEKTELTQEEKDAVLQLRSGEVKWKEFRYNEIFNHIEQGRRLKKEDQKPGNIPFVMSGVTNTGVVNYISNPVASFPANSITVDIFGNTFYRDFAYGLGDDTGAYYNDEKQYTKEQMLFITSAMGKSLEGKFSYGNKLRSSQSFVFKMYLPIAADGTIDWTFMQNLISAESRLAIRGVVKWKDSIGNKSQTDG